MGATTAIEPLEARVFLSVETFNLLSLLGYTKLGASYKYRTTGTIEDGNPNHSQTSTFSTKLTVGTKKQTYDGHASTIVKQTGVNNEATITGAWFGNSAGTFLMLRSLVTDVISASTKFHDTHVAPKSMAVGTKYTDTGTVDGSLASPKGNKPTTGTFSGTSTASSKLFGRTSITVRGTTYNHAVKGTFTVSFSGTLKLNVNGLKFNAPGKFSNTETFWAVPGTGVVKLQDQFVLSAAPPGQQTTTIKVTASSDLVSYVLPS